MPGIRVLADGRKKFSVLTIKPANVASPTAAELNAGLDFSCKVLEEGFTFGATDSEKVNEPALCSTGNANALGKSNYAVGFTMWRFFASSGTGFDSTDDAGFVAVRTKGTTLWAYLRQTDKLATTAWAAADEIAFGAEFVTDLPQFQAGGGFTKYRIPGEVQFGFPFIAVAGV